MPKFKVGEEVIVKHGKNNNMTLVIVQTEEITCSAGTQTKYVGRLWIDSSEFNTRPHRACITRDAAFNEIELEKKN